LKDEKNSKNPKLSFYIFCSNLIDGAMVKFIAWADVIVIMYVFFYPLISNQIATTTTTTTTTDLSCQNCHIHIL